jgi:polysaccharide deacetylase family protein (PEP-CTERM system associated)
MIDQIFDPEPLRRNNSSIASQGLVNAMSVDVEDYFQVQALAGSYSKSDWSDQELRVERNTERILDLFAAQNVKATFFTLGWIAERIPQTIKRIVQDGHELASHGYEHRQIFEQTPDIFRQDIRKTKAILEDIAGAPVKGYRAATFSITQDSLWAYEILADEGYLYSSSVYPVRHDLYGMPEVPRFAFRPHGNSRIVEYPMSTLHLAGRNYPGGGGGYFRIFPYAYSRFAINRTNTIEAQPYMFYFHPWEIDPEQPRPDNVGLKSRLRHYTNLSKMESKLERLLREFKWGRVDETFVVEGDLKEQAVSP